jgi:hypothetical protein
VYLLVALLEHASARRGTASDGKTRNADAKGENGVERIDNTGDKRRRADDRRDDYQLAKYLAHQLPPLSVLGPARRGRAV